MAAGAAVSLTKAEARQVWLRAQGLDRPAPFGSGFDATPAAVRQLGYVQIDTIAVIERCHHHILWTRIPDYRREHLHQAQSLDKRVFEYWTHALSYVPREDWRLHMPAMRRHRLQPQGRLGAVAPEDLRKVLKRIRDDGPLTIRDIDDDVLVEKDHPWSSRKPSKRALQLAFYNGDVTISARSGMLKTYELTGRHFGWESPPRPASERQVVEHRLERALRAQGLVSLDSVCHLEPRYKPAVRAAIEAHVRRGRLLPVAIEDAERVGHWAAPDTIEARASAAAAPVHLLSPFDPLVIQRRRLAFFFGYEHRFEAYLPQERRRFGYFALPVLVGDAVVAAIDLKADRAAGALKVRQWTWIGAPAAGLKARIEAALHRFEAFQLHKIEETRLV